MARARPGNVAVSRPTRALPTGPRPGAALSRRGALRLQQSSLLRPRQRAAEEAPAREDETRDGNRGDPADAECFLNKELPGWGLRATQSSGLLHRGCTPRQPYERAKVTAPARESIVQHMHPGGPVDQAPLSWHWIGDPPTPAGPRTTRVLHGTVAALHDFVHRHLGPAQGGGNPTAGDGWAITRLSPARGRRNQTFQVLLPLPGGAGPPPAGALNTEAPMGQAAAAGGYGT